MKKILFYTIFLQASLIFADEYLYPICSVDDSTILMMHQRSLDDIELLSVNTQTNEQNKLLSSLYLPAHVALIPETNSYSFIDRGRVYIKDFAKRTPRALNMYQSILDIQSLQWINNHQFIFSAKYKHFYKIFMFDITKDGGALYTLCNLLDSINYIFPAFLKNSLFCLMQRDSYELYDIIQIDWKPILFEEAIHASHNNSVIKSLEISHKNPLCFLTMQDENSGYVLEVIEHNKDTKIFTFGCCALRVPQKELVRLFEFCIPEDFIIGMQSSRLFESFYPLLPKYTLNLIYFTTYDQVAKRLILNQYDLEKKEVAPFKRATKILETRHIFSPLILKDKVYLGHNIEIDN